MRSADETHRWRDGVILGLALAGTALSMLLTIRHDAVGMAGGPVVPAVCLVHQSTSETRPSCGMTRSFVATAHGDLGAAFGPNLAGPLLFALMVVQLPLRAGRIASRRLAATTDRWDCHLHLAILAVGGALLLVGGVSRMLG